jgi:hypothetical protein
MTGYNFLKLKMNGETYWVLHIEDYETFNKTIFNFKIEMIRQMQKISQNKLFDNKCNLMVAFRLRDYLKEYSKKGTLSLITNPLINCFTKHNEVYIRSDLTCFGELVSKKCCTVEMWQEQLKFPNW